MLSFPPSKDLGASRWLAIIPNPSPLVVEVWSPSTGDDDLDTKLPVYHQRGDREIWRIHPYQWTLTGRQRQQDGLDREMIHREGTIRPLALPLDFSSPRLPDSLTCNLAVSLPAAR